MTALRTVALCALLATMMGCGGAHRPSMMPDTRSGTDPELAQLEAEQVATVQAFDETAAAGPRCDTLCHHLGHICALSDRICAVAERVDGIGGALACDRARGVCADATARLPAECSCPAGQPPP